MSNIYQSGHDLYSDAALADPYPIYDDLREGAPVAFLEPIGMYALTRYAHVQEALKTPEVFISGNGVMMNDPMNDATKSQIMLCSDGPQHQGMRRVLIRPLMPKSLAEIQDQITEEAEGLAERLVGQGSFDAVTDLAQYLPVKIVSDLVGLPEDGCEKMLEWASASFDTFGPISPRVGARMPVIEGTIGYMQKNNHPGIAKPGSWCDQLHAVAKEIGLPPEAAVMMGIDYMGPSLDTTIFAISSGVKLFAENPDEWAKLCANPDLMTSAINEIIRLESPIQGFSRTTVADYSFEDATIPAGSRVIMLYGAANRDPRQWNEPTAFNIQRDGHFNHLAFGTGAHACAGSNLAKMEMAAVFGALIKQGVTRFDLAGDGNRAINSVLRGYEALPVTVATMAA